MEKHDVWGQGPAGEECIVAATEVRRSPQVTPNTVEVGRDDNDISDIGKIVLGYS